MNTPHHHTHTHNRETDTDCTNIGRVSCALSADLADTYMHRNTLTHTHKWPKASVEVGEVAVLGTIECAE